MGSGSVVVMASHVIDQWHGSPASNAWREGSSFRAISSDESACTISASGSIRGFAEGSCVTSVVAKSDQDDLVAFAHTDPYNARTNTSGLSFSKNEGDSALTNRFSGIRQTKTPSGIYDMVWIKESLFAATASGSVLLYNTADIEGDGEMQPEATFRLPHLEDGAASSEYQRSQRVNQVSVADDAARFVAVDNSNLSMWDVNISQQVWINKNVTPQPLPTCELYGQNRDICLVGTATGAMHMFDFRDAPNQPAKKIEQAHSGAIHELSWSPFSPYWIASSGDDALVHVWDLRSLRDPVVVLTGHHNAVTELSWSNSHAEILASGSWDRTVKIWNLNSPPQHMMDNIHMDKNTHKPIFTDMIAGVSFSHKQPMGCLVATSVNGEVACISMNDTFLEPMVPHKLKFEDGDPSTKPEDCENNFYYRDIKKAVSGAIKLAKEYQLSDERLADANTLIEMCKAPEPIMEPNPLNAELSLDASEVPEVFTKCMDEFSSRLAPRAHEPMFYITNLKDPSISSEFEFLEKSVKILLDLAQCRFEGFNDKIEVLRGEPPEFWTGSGKKLLVLRRIVAEYLEADGPGAFNFALHMCDKFREDNCFSEFGLVADLVVHPSIYECEGRHTKKVGRDHLQEHCKDYDKIKLQIELQMEILTILHDKNCAQPSSERIIELFSDQSKFPYFSNHPHELVDESNQPQVVSLAIIHCYFSALTVEGMWDELIIQAINLKLCLNVTTGYTKNLEVVADKGYSQLLRSASSNLSAEDTLTHLRMVLKVLAKCKESTVTPKFGDFLTKVTPEISRLATSLTTFFEGSKNEPESEEYIVAKSLASETYSTLGKYKGEFEIASYEKHDIIMRNHRDFFKSYEDLILFAKKFSEE